MRFETDLPKEYGPSEWSLPPLDKRRRITRRVLNGLENVPYLYSNLGRMYAIRTENNSQNLVVRSVSLVGSGARENLIDSDLDLMLVCPRIDEQSANYLKFVVSCVTFTDRPKQEAIDVFLRARDKYPERSSIDITSQVGRLIYRYNQILNR